MSKISKDAYRDGEGGKKDVSYLIELNEKIDSIMGRLSEYDDFQLGQIKGIGGNSGPYAKTSFLSQGQNGMYIEDGYASENGCASKARGTQGLRYSQREQDMERRPKPPLPDPRLVKAMIRERQRRGEFFEAELFADPAWDILLDLTAARAEHRRVSVTSLCIAANVPATTALRWIAQMVEAGILERIQDDTDRRRAFIALSDSASDAMARYFDGFGQSGLIPV